MFTKYLFEKTRNSSFIHAAPGAIFCDRRRLFQEFLTHSFVFSALVLVGLDPGAYFLRETNIRVFIIDDALGFHRTRSLTIGFRAECYCARRRLFSIFVRLESVFSALDYVGRRRNAIPDNIYDQRIP